MKSLGLTLIVLGYLLALGVGVIGGLTMLYFQGRGIGIDAYVLAVYGSTIAVCVLVGVGLVIAGRRIRRRPAEPTRLITR